MGLKPGSNYTLPDAELNSYVYPISSGFGGETAQVVVNPDGSNIFSGNVSVGSVTVVELTSSTSEPSTIQAQITPELILTQNNNRKQFYLINDTVTGTAFVGFGFTPTLNSYTIKMGPQMGYVGDSPLWVGNVYAIWNVADGFMVVTELD